MSQHRFHTMTSNGLPVEVLIGYDRPLHGFFLVVTNTSADDDQFVYSNLDDLDLIDLGGLTLDLQHFKSKLDELGIALPLSIEAELHSDCRLRVGNRVRLYDSSGAVLPGSLE